MSRIPNWTTLYSSRLRVFTWVLATAWTLLVVLLVWSWWIHHESHMRDRARAQALTHLNKDRALRLWATSHGGVYVATDDRTPPNPFLAHVPEQNITTPSGKTLTLMNPAYVLRQVTQDYSDLYGVKGHITSLKPLRPGNAPDAWELAALESFERGRTEALEFTEIDGQPYLRLMRPIITEKGCLKCHGHQGYRVGDLRGGISVSTPMTSLLADQRRELATTLVSYGSLWLLGLGGIVLGYGRLQRNVRDQEDTIKRLWQSEERYRVVAERTGHLVRDYHVSPAHVEWSGAIGEITGCTELPEADIPVWEEMIHPDDRQQVLAIVAESMRDCSRYLVEYRLREKDASYIHVEERGAFLGDEAGRAYRLLAVIEDITRRKHAEEERAKMLHAMGERVKELTCIYGVAQSIRERETLEEVFQNVAALIPPGWRYTEITRGRVRFQGKEFVSEPFEETEWRQTSDISVDGEVSGSVEVYYLERCPELDEGPFMQEERRLIGGIARALSEAIERKQVEKEREKLIVSLEAQNAELECYAYTLSHELKSPLVTMGLYMGALREDITTGDADAIDGDFTRMSGATDKMVGLLDNLLELSKIGRLVRPPEEVALEELAREAVELVSRQIQEKGIQIDISPDLPVVFSDRTRLLEVMQNLIDNAVKYMGDQPKPRIEIGVRREEGETVCFVRDNGVGIDSRYQQKIFGLFEQLDQKIEGSGVGLALVKRIVELHGGRIWVESPGVGQGSTFCFTPPTKVLSATQEMSTASM